MRIEIYILVRMCVYLWVIICILCKLANEYPSTGVLHAKDARAAEGIGCNKVQTGRSHQNRCHLKLSIQFHFI